MCQAFLSFVNHVSSVCSIMYTWCATQDLDRANVELDEGNDFFPELDAQSDIIDDLGDDVDRDDEARRRARAEPGDSILVPSGGLGAVVAVEPVEIPPPPPPLPPPLEAGGLVHGRRPRRNWNRIDHPNGLGYVRLSKTHGKDHYDFRAVCNRHGCTLTQHGAIPGKPKGRPLGLLWHFLNVAGDHTSKASHRAIEIHATRPRRLRAREDFSLMEGAADFLSKERLPLPGEGAEPERLED
jgi:hypothetical protein